MLVWMEKPTEHNCAVMKCGLMHFMCGQKGKYGLNLQGVCNHIQRFTSIWILHPGLSSDFLSFIRSSLCRSLQIPSYLYPGLLIFGDLAYVNNSYMVTPYKNIRAGERNNFNFSIHNFRSISNVHLANWFIGGLSFIALFLLILV